MRIVLFSVWLIFICFNAFAQLTAVSGKVTDDHGKPVNFASIWIDTLNTGTVTNARGEYRVNLNPGVYRCSFRSPGYKPLRQTIKVQYPQISYNVKLSETSGPEIVPNYADSIIRKVIARANSKEDVRHYSGVLYNKVIQRL